MRISDLAARQSANFKKLADHPGIANPRQLGTIVAMDITAKEAGYLSELSPRLKAAFTARDILLRPLGNTVYVMPPYCIDDHDLARIYDTMVAVLDEF